MANIGGTSILLPTPGSTVTITISTDVPRQIVAWTAGQAETINISGTPNDGQILTMIITNDATLGRLLTLGTGLLGIGTVLNVISKKTILHFVAYGGTFHEISRTIGI